MAAVICRGRSLTCPNLSQTATLDFPGLRLTAGDDHDQQARLVRVFDCYFINLPGPVKKTERRGRRRRALCKEKWVR
mgnify:CR=1 FL=1